MKKKIAFVVTRSAWGGAQRYVFELAKNMDPSEWDVVVITSGSGQLIEQLKAEGIKVRIVEDLQRDIAIVKEFRSLIQLIRILQDERPNIVHLNSSKIGFTGAIAARIARVKHIMFTVHGFAFNEDRPTLVKLFFKCITWLSFVLQTHVIYVSETIKKEAPTYKITESKFIVIKNGIAPQVLQEKKLARALLLKTVEEPIVLPRDGVWLGSIAELTKNKGLIFGLRALYRLKQKKIHWFIIGEGDLEEKLKSLTKKWHLEEQVHFLGHIKDASAYVKAFDIYLLPSITESFGYVLLEAGLGKVPVIASAVGGVPEIIEHEKTGLLVEPKNSKAIAHAITKLLADKKTAKQLGSNLYKKITKNFTLDAMLKKTFACYTDCL